MSQPYAEAALAYWSAGWTGALPLPAESKAPPPEGWTGHHAPYPSRADLQAWLDELPDGNIGLRLPPGVLGVDVDAYRDKPGAATLAELEQRLGPLPATWTITARDDGISGIRLYRVPLGLNWRGGLPGIDTIHSGHRYAVAPPSIHPEGGVYRWTHPVPEMVIGIGNPPDPTELPELPLGWVAELVQPYARTEGVELADEQVMAWLGELRAGPMCRPVAAVLERESVNVANPGHGSRHDLTRDALRALVAFGGEGHSGGADAIGALAATFIDATTSPVRGSARSPEQARAEWRRLLVGAVKLAAAKHPTPATGCDCGEQQQQAGDDLAAIMGGGAVAATPPPPPPVPDDRPARGFIDPRDGLQTLALTAAVDAMGPLATDFSGRVYTYRDGVWLPDGERAIRHRCVDLLGERYRMMHAATVVDVVRSREPLLDDEQQDADNLNLPNGLLNWRTYTLGQHSPAVASTVRFPVRWNPTATCPNIERWMGQVFPADAREFVEEVIGYALFNGNPLHKAVLLFGRGRNGKGTFLRLLKALIGERNISSVTPQSLDDNRFRAAELYGKVANLVGDVDPRIFKATETFKQVTGGDVITAERKGGHPFQFTCRALMVAAFNELPRSADTSEGFFSRWIVVPMTAYFPAGVADPSVEAKMHTAEELEGLLVLAVRGLNRVMGRGRFEIPASVATEMEAFRRVADPVRAWLEELIEQTEPDRFYPRTELYGHYQRWCHSNGHTVSGAARLYERVEAAGVGLVPRKRMGTRGYLVIKPGADGAGS